MDNLKSLLDVANAAYDMDKDKPYGHVLVSHIWDDLDLFYDPSMLWIDIILDSNYKARTGRQDVSGSLTATAFHSVFKIDCRLPIFFKL